MSARTRRRSVFVFAMGAGAFGLAACNMLTGLSDDYREKQTTSAEAGEGEDSGPLDGGSDRQVIEPEVDAGCWGPDATVFVVNDQGDFLNSPVPNPRMVAGVSHPAEYDAAVPNEIYDSWTRLTWLIEPDGGKSPSGTLQSLASYCGARGGRVPSRMELVTIQDWSYSDAGLRGDGVNGDFFPDGVTNFYWTSTGTSHPTFVWGVWFETIGFGATKGVGDPANALLSLRCVRGPADAGPLPPHRYEVSTACNIVRDVRTRLEWERGAGVKENYTAAEYRCSKLPTEGRNPWRMPTYGELSSIVFTKAAAPALDTVAFGKETKSDKYWTSSKPARSSNDRIFVEFETGGTNDIRPITDPDLFSRCVRDMDD